MAESIDCAVIGAGVVGLAVARRLAASGREVVVLEAASAIGTGISSRSSEVIHAGIYYPKGSLKARLTRGGRQALYRYCGERGIPHRQIGKLIVATNEAEVLTLQRYRRQAEANGVGDLKLLAAEEARELEPELACAAALLSPSTGIIDSHALALALQADLEGHGGSVVLRTPVVGGRAGETAIVLELGGAEPMTIECRTVVNCAGLASQEVARSLIGFPDALIPPLYLAKGHYFTLAGAAPFRRLIYPVAQSGGLGIHVTLDLAGRARFGPDVQWIQEIDYGFDEGRVNAFYTAIRRYYPGLQDGALAPGYTGIRPKLSGPGEPAADFAIQGPKHHGVPGLVHLFGIESPGLTACLAIADHVAALLGNDPSEPAG